MGSVNNYFCWWKAGRRITSATMRDATCPLFRASWIQFNMRNPRVREIFIMTRCLGQILLLAAFTATSVASTTADSKQVAEAESVYADVNDSVSIVATIDSGFFTSYRGRDRPAWMQFYHKKRKELAKRLLKLPDQGLSAVDAKAVGVMRTQLASFSENLSAPFSRPLDCHDARRRDKDLDYASLRAVLVVCFAESAKNLAFEGGKINRQAALDMLDEVEQPERRKAVFLALSLMASDQRQ